MSKESEQVYICPYCRQPFRNPECEDLGKKYFGGEEKDGNTNRSRRVRGRAKQSLE